jgi:hypothetical protein
MRLPNVMMMVLAAEFGKRERLPPTLTAREEAQSTRGHQQAGRLA